MLLKTENLQVGYGHKELISSIGLSVEPGKIVTLIGPNGSGKSTILKTVARTLPALGGAVYLSNRSMKELDGKEIAKNMAVMLTGKGSTEYATCREIIAVGRQPYTGLVGTLRKEDDVIIDEAMELVDVKELAWRNFHEISDGQKQRVLLARALVQEPKLLVLDEPTSYLDVGYQLEFMSILKQLVRDKKIGILMSLHELDLASRVSDEVITITRENKIDRIGKPCDILTDEYIKELFQIRRGRYSIEGGGFQLEKVETPEEKEEINQKSKYGNTAFLMVQGTMSSAGKSLVVAGLCRILKQDGYKVAPFKSQNMALNSYITEDGLEMGRAQVMQAEAAGIKPDVHMNPILLKPTSDQGSQVIVNGEVRGNMPAREYFQYKSSLIPDIERSVRYLSERYDVIILEGAGSPAEINLKSHDIVNMGMAKLVDAPVLLVGDIDRGGVFAQLLGTVELLEEEERARVKGLIVNKFRGDQTILDPGIDMLKERGKIPVVGVLPYMDVNLEDEDSLTERFQKSAKGVIDLAVIRLTHISNFTDFDVFEQQKEVSVRYVSHPTKLGNPDCILLPGTKNTIADMKFLRESGFEAAILRKHEAGVPIVGICGGFQMLGESIKDPYNTEAGGEIRGLSLLPVETVLVEEKCRKQVTGELPHIEGILSDFSQKPYYGYEIHMGQTYDTKNQCIVKSGMMSDGNLVYGTYIHGIFDHEELAKAFVRALASRKNVSIDVEGILDYRAFKELEYDKLAGTMREYLDMNAIYEIMGLKQE